VCEYVCIYVYVCAFIYVPLTLDSRAGLDGGCCYGGQLVCAVVGGDTLASAGRDGATLVYVNAHKDHCPIKK
jgi:hypothetical protein